MKPHSTVTNYIDAQSTEYQFRLTQIRDIIHEVVPEAAESISYGMP